MSDKSSRRHFLQVLGAAASAGTVAACGSEPGISGDVAAGNVSALAEGSLQAVSGQPVAIGRDAGGVYAMSLICTHEDCDMSQDGTVGPSGVTCTCHGSRFTANGAVAAGPASSPLTHYEVEIASSGEITIHGDSVVDAATRTPVPA